MKFLIDSAVEKEKHEQKPLESCSSYQMSVDFGEENTGGEAEHHMSGNKYLEPIVDYEFVNPLMKGKPVPLKESVKD